MVTAAWLLRTWQRAVETELPPASKNRFLSSSEVQALKHFMDTDLEMAARAAMQGDPDNRLILADWLRQAVIRARAQEALERQEQVEREVRERQEQAEREVRDHQERQMQAERESRERERQRRLREAAERRAELKKIRDAEDQDRLKGVAPPTHEEKLERQALVCCGQPRNSLGRCNRCGSRTPLH